MAEGRSRKPDGAAGFQELQNCGPGPLSSLRRGKDNWARTVRETKRTQNIDEQLLQF